MKGRSPKEMAHSSAARRVGWACCGCADIMWAGAGPAYFQRTLLEVVSRSGQKERPLRHRPAEFCRRPNHDTNVLLHKTVHRTVVDGFPASSTAKTTTNADPHSFATPWA